MRHSQPFNFSAGLPKIRDMGKRSVFFVLLALAGGLSAAGAETVHVLQKGETLFALSRKYGVRTEEIMRANNIEDPDRLRAGVSLRIPDASGPEYAQDADRPSFPYEVERGDSLYGLARRFGVPVSVLAEHNGLDRNASLRIGQTLQIPGSSAGNPAVASADGKNSGGTEPAGTDLPAAGDGSAPMTDPRSYETKPVDAGIIWPVEAEEVAYLTGKIYGVSITSAQGAEVKNIASGTVLSIGPYRGFGQVVFVQSPGGYIYVYGGLEDIGVRSSDSLSFGDQLGKLGTDPLSGKPQLYFMVYKQDFPVDPATAPRG